MSPEEQDALARKATCVILLVMLMIFGPVFLWHCIQDHIEGGYTVEITGIKASNFTEAQDTTSTPSFDITMRVDNRYKNDLYFTDWQFAVFHDSIPLGRGSFPYNIRVENMSDGTGTGTTSSVLVGLAKEVHNHISTDKSFEGLELHVDMRFVVHEVDDSNEICTTEHTWLWCSSRLDNHSAPSPCRRQVVIKSRDLLFI